MYAFPDYLAAGNP